MIIAVFSDIHGNYVALQKCVEHALRRDIDICIFLGDYLGEFPYPQKTLDILYQMKEKHTCFFIRGNKEDYWIHRRDHTECEWKNGNSTVGAMQYCYAYLTEKDIDFFASLPICQEIKLEGAKPFLICHGSPVRNNEKLFPNHETTKRMLDHCEYDYILCGHTHLQGIIEDNGRIVLNPGAVGVSLHSAGKAQFMILHQDMRGWKHEFVTLDYDREKVIKEMKNSGLEDMAPYWCQVTKHLILTGDVSHGTVLAKAIKLCEEEQESCNWYDVPEKYWKKAIGELIS